jgi:hypothetical protein
MMFGVITFLESHSRVLLVENSMSDIDASSPTVLAGVFRVADNDFGLISPARLSHLRRPKQSLNWRERDERDLSRESRRASGHDVREIQRESMQEGSVIVPKIVESIRRNARDTQSNARDTGGDKRQRSKKTVSSSKRFLLPLEPEEVKNIERTALAEDMSLFYGNLGDKHGSTRARHQLSSFFDSLPSGKPEALPKNAKRATPPTSLGSTQKSGPSGRAISALPSLAEHEEYNIAKAREYSLTEPEKEFLAQNAELAAEAKAEYTLEEGVRAAAGHGVPKPGGKWGGGLEEFGVDLKGRPLGTGGYAFMP